MHIQFNGGDINQFHFENFNAYQVLVDIIGQSIHPGSAKNKMVNSQEVAMTFHSMLPAGQKPQLTEGYEVFTILFICREHVKNTFRIYCPQS